MPRETGRKLIAQNRKARHDYEVLDTYECGIVLQGTEVKSLREGRANLTDGYATVDDGEVWLRGVHIPEYTQGTWTNHAPRRRRKLLLHAEELAKILKHSEQKGRTIVHAEVPQTELSRYAIDLRSVSHGTGLFTRSMIRYDYLMK